MTKYILVSLVSGFLFGSMDAVINANPLAQKLFEVYKPIAKTTINAPAGIIIDLIYGFVMAGIFLLLYPSLPGQQGLVKGISYALILWFFRVLMKVASDWMMFNLPPTALFYTFFTGLLEMLVIGMIYGLFLRAVIE